MTTLFQLICTHTCLLFAGCFARTNKSLDDLEGLNRGRFAGAGNAVRVKPILNWTGILRLLPLAGSVAAEAALNYYVLYHLPFEGYLLSRALVLPLLLLLDRFVYMKISAGRLIYLAIALSTAVFITAFRPELPFSAPMLLIGILSSALPGLWLLQFQCLSQSTESLSKGEYTVVNTSENASKNGDVGIYTTWSLLCYTPLPSAIILIPVVLYSGELGHILRNCYFLSESRFWVYMSAGAMFRLGLFTSTLLLVRKASAFSAVSFCVLVNVTQIIFFTFNKIATFAVAWVGECLTFRNLVLSGLN
jgi:hypothetical protein